LAAGVNVCLGTDSATSNNDLDMLGEMRTASLLAKTVAKNASTLPAWQALEMATINGANALNAQDEIGSIEIGKSADMITINLNTASCLPIYDPISQIVYSASRDQVNDVWVAGAARVRNKELVDLNLSQILDKAISWGERIQSDEEIL
jgi:5-methylthioadenosine/S-adenosylhomocysteine deaminase